MRDLPDKATILAWITENPGQTSKRDIAKAFESQLTYPGEIKVTVVRESRFTEMAR